MLNSDCQTRLCACWQSFLIVRVTVDIFICLSVLKLDSVVYSAIIDEWNGLFGMLWFLLFVSMTAFAEFSENDFITELGWIEDDQYGMCYGYFKEPLLTKKANLGVNAASISAMDSGRIVGDKIELSGHVNLAYKNAEIKASKVELSLIHI